MRICIGIVFVIWLLLATLSAWIFRAEIESERTGAARRALEARGLEMVRVKFDHLDAILSGNVPNREMKSAAEEAVGQLEGVRVRENRITYGERPAGHLLFTDGDPVQVSGTIGVPWDTLGIGVGFAGGDVAVARRADLPWPRQLGALAENFFHDVSDARLEVVGQTIVMDGTVANESLRWRLIDQAEALGDYIDLADRLSADTPKPFAVKVDARSGALKFTGVVRDRISLLALGGGVPEADADELAFDPTVVAPAWLWRAAQAIRYCSRTALNASFELGPEGVVVAASFPGQFWLDAAERELRASLPDGLEVQTEFQVVRAALAEDDGGHGGSGNGYSQQLPVSLSVAAGRARVEGVVRHVEERGEIIRRLRESRPDLRVEDGLLVDPGARRLTAVRRALPDFFAFAASGISRDGSLEFDGARWRFRAVCRDPEFARVASRVAAVLECGAGLPIDLDLCSEACPDATDADLALAEYPIYFKPGSAQISRRQEDKIAALASLIESMRHAGAQGFTLTGFGRGDGSLARQRARAARRAITRVRVGGVEIRIRAARSRSPIDWRSDSVNVGIGFLSEDG